MTDCSRVIIGRKPISFNGRIKYGLVLLAMKEKRKILLWGEATMEVTSTSAAAPVSEWEF